MRIPCGHVQFGPCVTSKLPGSRSTLSALFNPRNDSMKKAIWIGLIGVALGALLSRDLPAATYSISAQITAASDASFNPLPSIPDISQNSGQPGYYTIIFTPFASNFNAAANQRGFDS